jgi:hypothetical protein
MDAVFGEAKIAMEGDFRPRKGLEGFSHAVGGTGARKRVAPQSPVFCGAKNAPKMTQKSKRDYPGPLTARLKTSRKYCTLAPTGEKPGRGTEPGARTGLSPTGSIAEKTPV